MQEHDMHMDHMDKPQDGGMQMMHMGNLKQKFWISLVLAVPILILSPMMGVRLPFQFTFPGSDWIVLALATILFFYGGMPFLQGAAGELKKKSPAMMTLIALGISVAYLYSVYAFVRNTFFPAGGHVMDFFWELATLIVIMLLGHWIEMNAISSAGDAIKSMAKLLPGSALVVGPDGATNEVPLEQLQTNQLVLVRAGEKVPADGTIEQGETSVNEAMVTGEARDVAKKVGDKVIGGSVNGDGTIQVRVTGTGETGYLAQVMQLVSSAQQQKSSAETLSDKVAKWLFYVAVIAGLAAFVVWLLVTGSLDTALSRMVTTLVIACPHALGLAIPLVIARSTSISAKNGLLVRNRQALEMAEKVTKVMMDKTGTLTEGRFSVTQVAALADGYDENRVLAEMAALEMGSTHPLAVGILSAARTRDIQATAAQNIQNIAGAGLSGTLSDGRKAAVVSAGYLDGQQIAYDRAQFASLAGQGNTVSYLVVDQKTVGVVAQGDTIKPEAKAMLDDLKTRGIQPVMLTGDNEKSAEAVAKVLGITEYHAALLPQDKEKIIREAQAKGDVVMMVGDGVNDAPSLARADIGMAIGAGTDVAIDSADVVLVKSDLADVSHFLQLATATSRKMKQNLWWGAGYNIVAIPLAAGVLAPVGVVLSPAVGAILMSLSTVIVAINAMTLRLK